MNTKKTDIKELYDKIFYGCDIEFKYNKFVYLISSGINENGKYFIMLSKYEYSSEETIVKNKQDGISEQLYDELFDNQNDMTESFLSAKLFTGKSLNEIINNIEILSIF